MKSGSVFKAALLVAGTAIGGGMLALPVLTANAGFVPSLFIYLLCWLFMAATGLLFLEVCLWMKRETNIVSMAQATLGTPARYAAWAMYLFLFYCLMLAYVVGGGNLVAEGCPDCISNWAGSFLVVIVFGAFVYLGSDFSGKINIPLMIGLGVTYLAFVYLGYSQVKPALLTRMNWSGTLNALPICFTAFAYQGIVPTLTHYLGNDKAKTRKAILIGSFLPFITYVVWQWLILGIVPYEGRGGLEDARMNGVNAIYPLRNFINVPSVYVFGQFFAFFALTTSLLGVALGLLDFLSDGLGIEKTPKGRFLLCLLIFIPPLLLAYTHPHVFLQALDFAGGFGVAFLLGLLPIMMVWVGRYRKGWVDQQVLPGGRFVLSLLLLFVLFELGSEFLKAAQYWLS